MNVTHHHRSWHLSSGVLLGLVLLTSGLTALAALLAYAPRYGVGAAEAQPAPLPVVTPAARPDTSVPDAATALRGDDREPAEPAPTF